MAVETSQLEERLQAVFNGVFGNLPDVCDIAVDRLEEWDSLSHIRLVMEIERAFGIEIPPHRILSLYTDFETVLAFLQAVEGP